MEWQEINDQIWDINRDFRKYSQEFLKDYDFTVSTLRYLVAIKRLKNVNLNEIALHINVDKAMVTRKVKKLVDLGFVNKEQDEYDTRSYKLSLTDKGLEILKEVKTVFKDWFDQVTYDFTEEEKDLYIRFIQKMYENRIYKK